MIRVRDSVRMKWANTWQAWERCDMYIEFESENRRGGDQFTGLHTGRTFEKIHAQLYVKVGWPLNININIYVNFY
jgi:hypothetical protein